MMFIGYALAIVMGIVLSLVGGGGSILAVPILVYIFGADASLSTVYSLFIVGISSFVAALDYQRRGLINFKVGGLFALPAFLSIYLVRRIVLPAVPERISLMSDIAITKNSLILLVFALAMLFSSVSMLRGKIPQRNSKDTSIRVWMITINGLLVGALTGFVGAGGGFLLIPALVLFSGIEMKTAVGTSLSIIAVNSLIGFLGDVISASAIDWPFLLSFTLVALGGIAVGTRLSRIIDSKTLKPAFGGLALVVGILIITHELSWL